MGTFGVAACIYKFFLYTSIILIVYNQFIQIKAVAALMLYSLGLVPILKEAKSIRAMSKKAGGRVNWTFSVITLAVVVGILFLPLSWSVTLPGEIRAGSSRIVSVTEGGYLKTAWPENALVCRKGDVLAELESPLNDLEISRVRAVLHEDAVMADLQQSDRETFGDSLLTLQKMDSSRKTLGEMLRRKTLRRIAADSSGLFIPRLFNLSPGCFLPGGLVLGEIVSGRNVVYAYATENEVKVLKEGQRATITFPDSFRKLSGRIVTIDPIPAKLRNSPLLQMYGGELAVFPDETQPGEFYSVQALYRVEIVPEGEADPVSFYGRSVRARVHRRDRLVNELWNWLVTAFRREM